MRDPGTIFLVGFSGSGKSTIGPRLAKRLGIPFYDTDAIIEQQSGSTIGEIFARDGARFFRQLETSTINSVITTNPGAKVVALGGGALLKAANRKLLTGSGVLIHLSCSVRELYRRIRSISDRPLLEVPQQNGRSMKVARFERIQRLLERRLPGYQVADICVSTSVRSVTATVDEICRKLRESDVRN